MKAVYIILIILGALILWGPIMLGFAKLNKVDPFILEKSDEEIRKDTRSFILVNLLKPLYVPLWLETKLIKKVWRKKNTTS